MEQIKSIEHLKEISLNKPEDYFILLKGGLRSSKLINFDGDKIFYVYNEIDDTEQELSEEELYTESSIKEAIDLGNFYKY